MAREIQSNAFNSSERAESLGTEERLEGFAAGEMADRGPKGLSSFTGEDDRTETRPVSHMYAEPGGADDEDLDDDDDDDFDDDDDLEVDEDLDVEDDDDIEIDDTVADDDLEDDDLVLDDDEEDEEDDL